MCDNWEKEKTLYVEWNQNFRHLNEIMWKVPVMAMSLTGGLWFGIASLDISCNMRVALLALSGLSNSIFIFVLWRLRSIMAMYLEKIRSFEGRPSDFGYKVVIGFSIILLTSAVICFYIIGHMDQFFKPKSIILKKEIIYVERKL